MNELQVFNNPEFGRVRAIVIEDMPWAVGKDVATALGYSDAADAIKKHVDPEDKIRDARNATPSVTDDMGRRNAAPSVTDDRGRTQYPIWINESGLYSLILSSKLPSAKRFKRWITSEVLPAIRATGAYNPVGATTTPQREITTDDYLRAATIVSGCRNERLPYVIGLLKRGGISLPDIEPISVNENGLEAARLINKAVNEHGMSLTKIGKLLGLHTEIISRIRSGRSIPKEPRASLIIQTLNDELQKQ